MNDGSIIATPPYPPVPPDDLKRTLTLAGPNNDKELPHVSVAGNIYTILVSGKDTNGHYCLIDMQVPPGGGPPPHRHDFEEMFTILEGEVEFTFRGEKKTAKAGDTVSVPANAPHTFKNVSDVPMRLLCLCSPAGQEEFFLEVGVPVESKDASPPQVDEATAEANKKKAGELAPKYRTEFVKP